MRRPINTYPARSGLTDEQAAELLDKLRTHYNQPVLPLSRVCNALEDWRDALEQAKARSKSPQYSHGEAYVDSLGHILTDIHKSGLLFRLLYLGEELRTEMCPTHQGNMEIQIWVGFPNAGTCECNGTGWLPNKS